MPSPQPSLKKLAALPRGINEYSDDAHKATMHNSGKAFLRALAGDLGLAPGSFDLRSNKGGIAVSGEVTLHSDRLYVQLSGAT